MSYTLGLLFEYHRYQHDAVMRIYADDRLVDELSLSSDINIKCVHNAGNNGVKLGDGFIGPENVTPVVFTPGKVFLFEIDEQYLCNCIRIEVENENNNHNNGFMTKFSYIEFYRIFLLPDYMFEYKKWRSLIDRYKFKKNWSYSKHADEFPRIPPIDEITLQPNTIQNNENWIRHKLGGSFSIEIPLSKKHRVTHLGRMRPGRISCKGGLSHLLLRLGLLNT